MDVSLFGILFFWAAFWLVVPWVIGRWYLSDDARGTTNLLYAAIALDALALALSIFLWGKLLLISFPLDIIFLFSLLLGILYILLSRNVRLFRIAACLQIAASVIFFGVVMRMFPQSVALDADILAPLSTIFLLLVNNVILLLLWHRSEPRGKRFRHPWGTWRTAVGLSVFLLVTMLYWYFVRHI